MIENKRFKLVSGIKLGTHSGIWDSRKQHNQGIGDELWLGEVVDLLNKLHKENEELRQQNKKILDTINNKITEKGINWYGAEDNSKEEKEANLQLKVLEEIREELKEILNLIKGD